MNKKTKKIIIVVSILLVVYLFIPFFRNPLSDMITRMQVKNYLEENYNGMGYEIQNAEYNYVEPGYRYTVAVPGSTDRHFEIYTKKYGGSLYDTFDMDVALNFNVADRLRQEYHDMVAPLLEDETAIARISGYGSGYIHCETRKGIEAEREFDGKYTRYTLAVEDLIPDHEYDINDVAKDHGRIVLHIEREDISYRDASEILLKVKEIMDSAEIAFKYVDLVLSTPHTGIGDGSTVGGEIAVRSFLYQDIYEEGLAERVENAYKEYMEFYGEPITYFGEE